MADVDRRFWIVYFPIGMNPSVSSQVFETLAAAEKHADYMLTHHLINKVQVWPRLKGDDPRIVLRRAIEDERHGG